MQSQNYKNPGLSKDHWLNMLHCYCYLYILHGLLKGHQCREIISHLFHYIISKSHLLLCLEILSVFFLMAGLNLKTPFSLVSKRIHIKTYFVGFFSPLCSLSMNMNMHHLLFPSIIAYSISHLLS